MTMMLRLLVFVAGAISLASAQQINFDFTTGTRSLWIPFKTVSGIPVASILGRSDNNQTTYVVSCPTGQPQCAFAPNITVTEGTDMVRYVSSTSGATSGTVTVNCPALTAAPVTCSQLAQGGGNIQKTSGTIPASEIVYSAVNVTALKSQTGTGDGGPPDTVTVTQTPSSTSTPNGVMATITAGPLAVAGAVGAGLLAMAAL